MEPGVVRGGPKDGFYEVTLAVSGLGVLGDHAFFDNAKKVIFLLWAIPQI